MESIATEIERSSGYRIDVTSKTNLWGKIDVWDIESDAVMIENLEIEGYYVDLAAISPETLFIVKASSMREKDRNDLSVVLPLTSPEKIMERFASLWTRQDFFVRDESLVNILSEIQLVNKTIVSPEWFALVPPNILKKWHPMMEDAFGIDIGGKNSKTEAKCSP